MSEPIFTLASLGTVFDGAHGWHNTYRVVDLAMHHGFTPSDTELSALGAYRADTADDDQHCVMTEQGGLADRATEFLESVSAPGLVWVWDMGELSLTTVCRTEDFDPRCDECDCGTCEVEA